MLKTKEAVLVAVLAVVVIVTAEVGDRDRDEGGQRSRYFEDELKNCRKRLLSAEDVNDTCTSELESREAYILELQGKIADDDIREESLMVTENASKDICYFKYLLQNVLRFPFLRHQNHHSTPIHARAHADCKRRN